MQPTLRGGQKPLPSTTWYPPGRFQIANPVKLPSTRRNAEDAKEAAFFLHAGSSSLLERKAGLEVEGAGVKGFIYQFWVKDQRIQEGKGQRKHCMMDLKISAS
ncbi:hypothetical protein llap_18024 [Limosa lapponica baueri]|uniref:Uncharacterized protein n=1 Tax=Limosa lapponica baueri TaxID=1758121 RepID=A0A2I0TD23_LIMLA|nr:hypothetical protein llap_18024 [Limosa lapponica baueri]